MSGQLDIREFHWLLDVVQSIDVGIVVLDRQFRVLIWNGFMENHSGMRPENVREQSIFKLFPMVDEEWFRRKMETVMLLNNRAFTIWEQRPYLFPFSNYRPITGMEPLMFQNLTLIPLASTSGSVDHVALIVYDVTDIAVNRKQLQSANAELERLSRTDRLTQLLNRGYWEERLQQQFLLYKRHKAPVSMLMFDIDHFKKVNDTYGHQTGDDVIRHVSDMIRKNLRETDIAGRYGGEEFGIILPNTDAAGAMNFAERLRLSVANSEVANEHHSLKYTISIGVAELNIAVRDYKSWLESSDHALYDSKHAGRNRVTLFGS